MEQQFTASDHGRRERTKLAGSPLREVPATAGVESFAEEIREVIAQASVVPTPALGRGAAAAIAAAIEQVADEVRGKVKELVELCAAAEREGEELIAEFSQRGLALESKIESYARVAHAARTAIRDAGTAAALERRP